MEAFEHFVAVALQAEHFVVSSGVKFPVRRQVDKKGREEHQTHGYEVDLVGARADRLVLATVKSFFGSRGVQAREVTGDQGNVGLYRLLNDPVIREGVAAGAAERYGYRIEQVSLRLYVGKFAGADGADETAVRAWCERQRVGAGTIEVVGLRQVVEKVRAVAQQRTYINDPVVVSMKVLSAARLLDLSAPLVDPPAAALVNVELDED
jgi:hypothetical protein